MPDYQVIGQTADENDLIRVYANLTHIPGTHYVVSKDSENLRFWKSGTKNEQYTFTDGRCAISGSGSMWAEYASTGNENYTFMLQMVETATSKVVLQEEMVFRPFNSITCAFVGEFQTAGQMDDNHGVNIIARDLLLDGYDVHVWDDGHDWSQSDDADEWGSGPVYDTIVNAVNNHGQTKIALFGYSHGGGTVYNVAWRIGNNYADSDGNTMSNPRSLVFTSYIDAVRNSNLINVVGENRRPAGSLFHLNQYQENDWVVDGCTSNGTADVEVGRSGITGMTHRTIDDNVDVQSLLKIYLKFLVLR